MLSTNEKFADDSPLEGRVLEDGYPSIDKAKEKKLVRKLDIHIIPVVMLLYLLSFLDR